MNNTRFKNIEAEDFARSLTLNCERNILKGRLSGEHIPYTYQDIDGTYYIGCYIQYDDEMGLGFYLIYPKNTDVANSDEYSHFLDWMEVVRCCIDYFLEDVDINELVDAMEEKCIPFTIEDARKKTLFLKENKCLLYI